MKGYRTIAFAIATILLGLLGRHVAPEVINAYLDVIFASVGLGAIVLRLVTDTRFGTKIAADLGTSPEAIKSVIATLDPDSQTTLSSAVVGLNDAVTRLLGHPLTDPAVVEALKTLAASVDAASANKSSAEPSSPIPVAGTPDTIPAVQTA